jgi:hypothetical protein
MTTEERRASKARHRRHTVHAHAVEVEAAWRAGWLMAIGGWEVTIAVGIGSRWGDVSWIQHVCVDKLELVTC